MSTADIFAVPPSDRLSCCFTDQFQFRVQSDLAAKFLTRCTG
uniref:Uncharacterized protein n=1 Tax=Arundo donax TaxID=35708 RepID=A0A0A9I105_ARUDO